MSKNTLHVGGSPTRGGGAGREMYVNQPTRGGQLRLPLQSGDERSTMLVCRATVAAALAGDSSEEELEELLLS